jgi:lipopolysaccharide export LptBFGC system permease protein LptF
MINILQDSLTGLLNGLISGVIAFFVVLLLAFFYRFFTNEKLPTFIGIAFGLGFWDSQED